MNIAKGIYIDQNYKLHYPEGKFWAKSLVLPYVFKWFVDRKRLKAYGLKLWLEANNSFLFNLSFQEIIQAFTISGSLYLQLLEIVKA